MVSSRFTPYQLVLQATHRFIHRINHRFTSQFKRQFTRRLTFGLAVLSLSITLADRSFAQTPTASNTADKAQARQPSSAFEGYSAYSDDELGNWKAANYNVERIGGWREYARQARTAATPAVRQQPSATALTPTPKPATEPKSKASP